MLTCSSNWMSHLKNIVNGKMSMEENFHSFCGLLLNRDSFSAKYGLVDQQYKSITMLKRKFYRE